MPTVKEIDLVREMERELELANETLRAARRTEADLREQIAETEKQRAQLRTIVEVVLLAGPRVLAGIDSE